MEISDQLSINYKELLQLHEKLIELDERVKTEIENTAKAKKQEDRQRKQVSKYHDAGTCRHGDFTWTGLIVEMANGTYLEIVDKRKMNL